MKAIDEIREFVEEQHGPDAWDPMPEVMRAKMADLIESYVVHLQWRQIHKEYKEARRALDRIHRAALADGSISLRDASKLRNCLRTLSQRIEEREKSNHIMREHLAAMNRYSNS